MPDFTTGPAELPDVGRLEYNGCEFSPLFESSISGVAVKDDAKRTVKETEITLTVDGFVTLKDGLGDIGPTVATMHRLLTAQGGSLTYQGRGFNLDINPPNGGDKRSLKKGDLASDDFAWGPIPELLDFQPLGGGRSAKVKWRVTVRTSAMKAGELVGGKAPLLQFNYETTVAYGEDYFSTISMRGTLEVPITRNPSQATRTVPYTADDFREEVERRLLSSIDLSRFVPTRRSFTVSRDKRTLTWDVTAEEKPYMDLPPYCPIARGTYSVRPAKTGAALITWLCTLRVTYTLRSGMRRAGSYLLFLALMRTRMAESEKGELPNPKPGGGGAEQQEEGLLKRGGKFLLKRFNPTRVWNPIAGFNDFKELITGSGGSGSSPSKKEVEQSKKAILIDFTINEGLYKDSKTMTYSATWKICTKFTHILVATGLWRKLNEVDGAGKNLWVATMRDVSGATSWLENRLDPKLDVIVDFGSG